MAFKMVPLSFDLIEEGRFKQSVNDALAKTMRELLAHVQKYGAEVTAKSKGELNIKIVLQFDGAEETDYSVKASISTKIPGPPVHTTKAIHEIEQTGEDMLFVRASGSSSETPRQRRLCTEDGRPIDPTKGEAPPLPPPEPKGKAPDRRSAGSGE